MNYSCSNSSSFCNQWWRAHTETYSFVISKLKNLLENTSNTHVVTGICGPSKSRARHDQSFKLDLKLKYLKSDQLLLS